MKSGYHGWKRTAAKWRNKIYWRIDVYPFVAVNLALLIIFMIVPGVTPRQSSGPELPRSRYASAMLRAVREDAQIVSVRRDGRIFYGNTVIAVDELPDRIRESIKNGADRKVYVRADARARYGDIQRVLDEISKTGIRDVCFFAERVSL